MKTFVSIISVVTCLGFCSPSLADVIVGFSPGVASGQQTAESVVLASISNARKSIHLAVYHFNSHTIAKALLDAKRRGVDIEAVLDSANDEGGRARHSEAAFLSAGGVSVRTDSHYAVMHDKFMVIDGSSVQTGSYNYTNGAARTHAENALWLRGDPKLVSQYDQEWNRLWNESVAYQ